MASLLFYQVGLYYRNESLSFRSWITEFCHALEIMLAQSGHNDISWVNHWEGMVDVTIVVVSNSLIEDYPTHRPNALRNNTIMKVMPYPISEEKLPAWLQEIQSYPFFKYDPYIADYQVFNKHADNGKDKYYWKVLDELVIDIAKLIKGGRAYGGGAKKVYLGYCTKHQEAQRQELARALKYWGYQAVPVMLWSGQPTEEEVNALMQQCQASIHFSDYGTLVGWSLEESEIMKVECQTAAKVSDFKQFIWLESSAKSPKSPMLDKYYNSLFKKPVAIQYFFECSFIKLQYRLKENLPTRLKNSTLRPYIFAIEATTNAIDWSPLELVVAEKRWELIRFAPSMEWSKVKSLLGNAVAIILTDCESESVWREYWSKMLVKANAYANNRKLPLQYWLGTDPPEESSSNLIKARSLNTIMRQLREHLPYLGMNE